MTETEPRANPSFGILTGIAWLVSLAVLVAMLITLIAQITEPRIAHHRQAGFLAKLHEIVPAKSYDNDLLDSHFTLTSAPSLGFDAPFPAYVARRGTAVVTVILPAIAQGYKEPIRLLIGITPDGRLAGVSVQNHQETPGYGERMDRNKSSWLDQFFGLSLGNPPDQEWEPRKDGGQFDQISGATITTRGVIHAVRDTLRYYADHRNDILTAAAHPTSGQTP